MVNKKNKALVFANIVLFSTVAALVLAIVYLWYKSTSQQIPFNSRLGVVLASGLLCSVASLFIRDNWKTNITAVLFSTVIAAYGVEFVLFVQHGAKFSPTKIDPRSKLEVIEDLRAEGVDAWPHVRTFHFTEQSGLQSDNSLIFPLGGISRKQIVYCNESGQYKIFASDEHGFNNPEGQYKKGNFKAALVGDSFALGHCVTSEEEIASRLRNSGISTLNLGNGGNGPLIELAVLKEYVEPFQPQIVLWIYYEGNDLLELEKEQNVSILMNYLKDDYNQILLTRQSEIDSILIKHVNTQWMKELPRIANQPQMAQEQKEKESRRKVISLWYLRNRLGLINTDNQVQNAGRITNFKSQLPLISKILSTAHDRTTDWGGKFYFVYLTTMERYIVDVDEGSFYDRDDVLAIVHKLGIPLIDIHAVLKTHPDPLSLVPFAGAHYNAEGYKLVSDSITDRLRKDGLISEE